MTTFVYKAKKNSAETVTGEISAQSQEEAIDIINQLGLLPVSVEAQGSGKDVDLGKPRKFKSKELYVFSRQMSNLLRSGVAILRSLKIIEQQTQNPYFKKIIGKIASDIKNGRAFSECLKDYPNVFSSLYVTMAKAGEESGNLQEMLVSVAVYQKKQEEVKSKVRSAITYPIIMLLVGMATVYFILTFALPKMASLFENLGDSLPLPTVILLTVSNILAKFWPLFIIVIAGVGIFLNRYLKSEKGQYALSQFTLKIPFMGEILLKSELSRFSRSMALLLNSGVSIIRAIRIAIPILSNELIKKHLEKCRDDLTAGGSFGQSLKEFDQIPPMMGHLISIGEESGNLSEVLTEIADTYEQETDEKTKIMTTLLEPIMILVIGLIIGFIVFAMLLPIFQVDVLA